MNMRRDRFVFTSFLSGLAFYAVASLLGCPPVLADETAALTVRTAEGKLYAQPVKIAPVMETLEKGTQVRLLEQKGEWYAVSLPDLRLGWAHQSIFVDEAAAETGATPEPSEASPAEEEVGSALVKVPSGRVRKAPSLSAPLAFGLNEGDRVTVLATRGDWHHIKDAGGRTGWIYHTLVALHPPSPKPETREDNTAPGTETAAPAGESAGVEPETAAPETETAAPPAKSAGVEPETAEAKASPSRGKGGFAVITRVRSGRVRTGPSMTSPTAFGIPQGTRAEVLETDKGWYRILLQAGRTGWAYKTLFDTAEEGGAAPPAQKTETPSDKQIQRIRFEITPEGHETITFELNSFNPPRTYTVDDKDVPMVICEFEDTRLSSEIGDTIPAKGKMVTALSVRRSGGKPSTIQVQATLDPRFKYSVDQVFSKRTTATSSPSRNNGSLFPGPRPGPGCLHVSPARTPVRRAPAASSTSPADP